MKKWKKILLFVCALLITAGVAAGIWMTAGAGGSMASVGATASASTVSASSGVSAKKHAEELLNSVPEYSGSPYIAVNSNKPSFTDSSFTTKAFESYSALDSLGRCGTALANVCRDTMPTAERGSIGSVKPSGWKTVKYDGIDGKYLYNRCHLIGYQLTAENANEKNLITGTRYLNVEGMLPFENMVADYVKETNHHVLYRVTPIFDGDNLVASGVEMEAESVEDKGDGISFHVYCYNVQPGITIDYADGDSVQTGSTAYTTGSSGTSGTGSAGKTTSGTSGSTSANTKQTYILNVKTKVFHLPSCPSVKLMKNSNKKKLTMTRSKMISKGYKPCKRCKP